MILIGNDGFMRYLLGFFRSSFQYSLQPILLLVNTDVSTIKICLDTSILAKSIMDRREYLFFTMSYFVLLKMIDFFLIHLVCLARYAILFKDRGHFFLLASAEDL
jgi:hypothetical protein